MNIFRLIHNLFYNEKIIKTYSFVYSIIFILILRKYSN